LSGIHLPSELRCSPVGHTIGVVGMHLPFFSISPSLHVIGGGLFGGFTTGLLHLPFINSLGGIHIFGGGFVGGGGFPMLTGGPPGPPVPPLSPFPPGQPGLPLTPLPVVPVVPGVMVVPSTLPPPLVDVSSLGFFGFFIFLTVVSDGAVVLLPELPGFFIFTFFTVCVGESVEGEGEGEKLDDDEVPPVLPPFFFLAKARRLLLMLLLTLFVIDAVIIDAIQKMINAKTIFLFVLSFIT